MLLLLLHNGCSSSIFTFSCHSQHSWREKKKTKNETESACRFVSHTFSLFLFAITMNEFLLKKRRIFLVCAPETSHDFSFAHQSHSDYIDAHTHTISCKQNSKAFISVSFEFLKNVSSSGWVAISLF